MLICNKHRYYNFPYAGYVYASSLRNVGSWGHYWSRTAFSTDGGLWEPDAIENGANGLSFNNSSIIPADIYYGERYIGFSIRCVATT